MTTSTTRWNDSPTCSGTPDRAGFSGRTALLFHAAFTAQGERPHSTVRLQVYPQVTPSSRPVVDWVRGTSVTRFCKRLPVDSHQPFVDIYTKELLATIGEHEPYVYAFKRILMAGRQSR
jgi:trans-aconitate methyltransferase